MPDKVDDLQIFVNHTVLEVLCKADSSMPFNINLFHPRFREMVDNINNQYIFDPINLAYEICKKLSKRDLRVIENTIRKNNRIGELCQGHLEPITFDDINSIDTDLSDHLYTFCKSLYENVLGLKPFYIKHRHIDEHYKLFSKYNKFNRCPTCGLKRLLKPEEVDFDDKSKREAYDHYFNKARYPFSSVNFHNLIPICGDCNSKYKTQRDVINNGTKRVKAFDPFSEIPDKTFKISYSKIEEEYLKDVSVDIECVGFDEEVETWDRITGVKSRYATYLEGDDFKNALEQALMFESYGKGEDYKDNLKNNLYANENFLKLVVVEKFF